MITKGFSTLFIICLLIFISSAIYFYHFIRLPWDWIIYTNRQGRYSFAHPKEWIVSECGNGEVVVGNQSFKRCYYPLEAPQTYLDSLYFQVFLPGRSVVAGMWSDKNAPQRLKGWTLVSWYWKVDDFTGRAGYVRYWGKSVPINPEASTSALTESEIVLQTVDTPITIRRQEPFPFPNERFKVGFISTPTHEKTMEKILQSVKHFR